MGRKEDGGGQLSVLQIKPQKMGEIVKRNGSTLKKREDLKTFLVRWLEKCVIQHISHFFSCIFRFFRRKKLQDSQTNTVPLRARLAFLMLPFAASLLD